MEVVGRDSKTQLQVRKNLKLYNSVFQGLFEQLAYNFQNSKIKNVST